MKKFPKVFIINLQKDTERWKNIIKRCKNESIKPVRFNAVYLLAVQPDGQRVI